MTEGQIRRAKRNERIKRDYNDMLNEGYAITRIYDILESRYLVSRSVVYTAIKSNY